MNQSLFPEMKTNSEFVFKISFEGSSFNGVINLTNLAEELTGLSYCLNAILNSARNDKLLDLQPYEYEFLVEPFEKGSFKKRVKLVAKTIEKYPASTNAVLTIVLIFSGIVQAIITRNDNQPSQNDNSSQKIEKIKEELLTDKNFLNEISKIVSPLSESDDKVVFTKPDNNYLTINRNEKEKFINLTEEDFQIIQEVPETLRGRVTRVDLTATKNAIGFKVNDSGATIPASFLDSINYENRKLLLDRIVEISGVTSKNSKERISIVIHSYRIIPGSIEETLPFINSDE